MAIIIDRNSKADTRLLIDRVNYSLYTDISQYRTDLTNNTTYFTSTDTRLAIRSPREISMVVNLDTINARILLNWGNTAGTVYIYRIDFSAATTVRFGHNNASLLTMALPGTPTVTPKKYLIHWSTDYDNYAATYYSECAICDIASNIWSIQRIDHTQPQAPVAAEQFNLGGYGAGVNILTDGMTRVDYCRIGCRFHSTTEATEDWVAATGSVTKTYPQLTPASTSFYTLNPNEAISNALLDEKTFAGPIELLSIITSKNNFIRLFSPIVNNVYTSPVTWDDTFTPANFYKSITGGYKLNIAYKFIRPVPLASHSEFPLVYAKVKVFAQTWIAAGAPVGTAVNIYMAGVGLIKLNADKYVLSATPVTSTTNHTSTGLGEWFDLGSIPCDGVQGFALLYDFGNATGHAYLRIKIKALVIEPRCAGYDSK